METLQRECVEELGAEADVGELALVREYIGKNHEFSHFHGHTHGVDFMFHCTLRTPVDLSKVTQLDDQQIGTAWIPFGELEGSNIYPKALKAAFDKRGNIVSPVYLGDVN